MQLYLCSFLGYCLLLLFILFFKFSRMWLWEFLQVGFCVPSISLHYFVSTFLTFWDSQKCSKSILYFPCLTLCQTFIQGACVPLIWEWCSYCCWGTIISRPLYWRNYKKYICILTHLYTTILLCLFICTYAKNNDFILIILTPIQHYTIYYSVLLSLA
jgi:hypothetical protein